jgi:pimeloyl-ACP methyl ester carboxylesterase
MDGSRNPGDWWSVVPKPGATSLSVADLEPSASALAPRVASFARVCTYDRPGAMLLDGTLAPTTTVAQPTTAQQGVADLHAWLSAAGVPGPYVLVAHSWGGLIATLFARMYPADVAGLVLVDPASTQLRDVLTPVQWATFLALTRSVADGSGAEAPDYVDSMDVVRAAPPPPIVPAVVITSDQSFDFGAGGPQTWPAWGTAQARLAEQLHARHVTRTSSGHAIPIVRPELVAGEIRAVMDAARSLAQ